MRTYKFRGKDTNTGEWVFGDLHLLCSHPHIHTAVSSFPFAGKRSFVMLETIGQFTGLYDKNGTEVYEGDIIEWKEPNYYNIGAVAWRDRIVLENSAYHVGWCVEERHGKAIHIIAPSAIPHGVVVGNVFDNLELLKNETD